MKNQSVAAVAEPTRETWPAPDFLNTTARLRHELESAIRHEKDLAQRVASIQDAAFKKALPAAMLAGGPDKLETLSNEQAAAMVAVNQKREDLRRFLTASRGGFFALRNRASEQLRAEISERFARAQEAAAEVCVAVRGFLGADVEAKREEKLIRQWNREVKKFNRSIPATNVNAIPGVAGIDPSESIRSHIIGMLLGDPNIRMLCPDFLAHEAQQRDRAVALEEARLDQAEATANPVSLVEPF